MLYSVFKNIDFRLLLGLLEIEELPACLLTCLSPATSFFTKTLTFKSYVIGFIDFNSGPLSHHPPSFSCIGQVEFYRGAGFICLTLATAGQMSDLVRLEVFNKEINNIFENSGSFPSNQRSRFKIVWFCCSGQLRRGIRKYNTTYILPLN